MTKASVGRLAAAAACALGFAVSAPAFAQATVSITGANCTSWTLTNNGGAFTLACVTGTPAPAGAPTGCYFSAQSPASLSSAGGAISMTATCSGTVTSWAWTKNSGGWANDGATASSTKGDALPANAGASPVSYSYTAQACNGSSCATAISTTFTVAASGGGGGGGGGGGPISCSGFTKTTPLTVGGTGWAAVGAGVLSMDTYDAVVLVLNVPAQAFPYAGVLSFYDQYAVGNDRRVTISKTPCTWAPSVWPPDVWSATGSSGSWTVWVGNGNTSYGNLYLDPGATYYVNIKNNACSYSPLCDLGFQFSPPH